MLRAATALRALALAAALACAGAAFAQGYPAKPVRLIISSAPGGPGDIVARGWTQAMTAALGQTFIVENRIGADGLIAAEACARATPDGYTICSLDGFVIATNPAVRAKMPIDTTKDLDPVVHLGMLAAILGANIATPGNTFQELLEYAKANPNKITWASFGAASSASLYMEWLRNTRDIHFYNVPYKSAAPAFQGAVSGEANLVVYSLGLTMNQVRAGKMKALAVSTPTRHPAAPNVPTMTEAGLDIAVTTWFGVFAPAGTPKEAIRRLNGDTRRAYFDDPALKEKFLNATGVVLAHPAGAAPEEFAAFIVREKAMYQDIVKRAKIKVE